MTPDSPQDPQKGKVDEGQVAEEAKATKEAVADEAAAQPEPKPKRKPRKTAEETAAAETGVDKAAAKAEKADEEAKPAPKPRAKKGAAAEAETEEAKPARKPRAKKAAEPAAEEAAAEPKPEEQPAEKPAEKPARPAPRRKRDERRPVEAGVSVSAHAKYVRTSARKARLVCDHIRGKDVAQARAILAFTPRAAAKDWAKLLESAVANAEHNHELVGEELRIAAVYADEGPTLKRYRPRAMGRATRIRKRTSHLTITLTPKEL
jgi:ribosomal protein L22